MLDKMPTLEELKIFYESEMYVSMLKEFAHRMSIEIGYIEEDKHNQFFMLLRCQRRYMVLNEDFVNVIEVIENNREHFIDYQVEAAKHFDDHEIDTTYLMERFCEYYLLHTGENKRLYNYLAIVQSNSSNIRKTSNIPRIYQEIITNLYYNVIAKP